MEVGSQGYSSFNQPYDLISQGLFSKWDYYLFCGVAPRLPAEGGRLATTPSTSVLPPAWVRGLSCNLSAWVWGLAVSLCSTLWVGQSSLQLFKRWQWLYRLFTDYVWHYLKISAFVCGLAAGSLSTLWKDGLFDSSSCFLLNDMTQTIGLHKIFNNNSHDFVMNNTMSINYWSIHCFPSTKLTWSTWQSKTWVAYLNMSLMSFLSSSSRLAKVSSGLALLPPPVPALALPGVVFSILC